MEAIYIPQLAKKSSRTEIVELEEFLPNLETLTPIRGSLRVTHQGNYLEIAAQAETIVTLTCDRCLKQYNHRLALTATELIWLEEITPPTAASSVEVEVDFEDLVETLSPYGYFQPEEWLYEQLCLELPPRKLCDRKCEGIPLNPADETNALQDSRWSSLAALKSKLS